jgi:putative membrane protein
MAFEVIVRVLIEILLYALSIWIVSKLGLGLKVSSFVPALIAAVFISVAGSLIVWLLGVFEYSLGGFIGAVIHLIIAALVLMFAGNMVKRLRVKGLVPAMIGAVAIAVVSW